ncbi:MAG: P1 family peptidase [Tranquillimonas sp.]
MTPGARNLLTDIGGLLVGNAADPARRSGVTVVTADRPFVAAMHVMGGAPGTRETDLLHPAALVTHVDALVLSGGSAFGLAAATGVAEALADRGRGFPAGGHRVPIVPAAILFDLAEGTRGRADYAALGRAAFDAAAPGFAIGSVGAGTGATTARLRGGLGSASAVLADGARLGALAAVNPVGTACDPDTGRFWAAPFECGAEFGGGGPAPAPGDLPTKLDPKTATVICVVATDATLDKAQAQRLAVAAHDGIARAILPSHTPFDGDLVFAAATGTRPAPDTAGLMRLGHAAAVTLSRAIARAVHAAAPAGGVGPPAWSERYGAD